MVTAAALATPRGSARETSETIRNWIDILKSLVAFLLVGLLLFLVGCDRDRLKTMAREMGIAEVSGPGVKTALETSSDALPRNEAALKEAQSQIRTLRESYSTAVDALPAVKAINRYSTDAYIVTLASWCPGADLGEDPVACNS